MKTPIAADPPPTSTPSTPPRMPHIASRLRLSPALIGTGVSFMSCAPRRRLRSHSAPGAARRRSRAVRRSGDRSYRDSPLPRGLPRARTPRGAGPSSVFRARPDRPRVLLFQVVLQLAAPARVTQLAQRLRLDLADPLARDVELAAHLFERACPSVLETEAQLKHPALATGQSFEDALHLLLEELVRRRVRWRERLVVGDEVTEVAVLLFADRRLERDRLLRDLHDLAHLVRRDEHPLGDLFRRRLAAELLEQAARHADELVDRLHHVDRDADRPRLVRDGARDGLTDPPRRVGRELVALPVVELLDGADEPDVPFLDEIEERHAPTDVLLRDRHHQSQVRLGEVVPRIVALLDQLVGEAAQRALLVRVGLDEHVQVLHENVADLLAEHHELAQALGTFGRSVDLRVLRQDAERETLRIALGSVDERDRLVDEHLRFGRDLLAVRLCLQRIAQLQQTVREAAQLLATLRVSERAGERLHREARRLVDELPRTTERHALLDLDAQLVEMDDRERRRHERLLPQLDRLREVDLFLRGQQRDLADLLEVHADRVVDADEVAGEDRRDGVLALQLLGLFLFLFDLGPVRAALRLEDLDVVVVEREEQLLNFTRLGVRDRPNDVLLRDVTL